MKIKKTAFILVALSMILFSGCETLKQIVEAAGETATEKPLTEAEIVSGLKEALKTGTENAVGILNRTDGYFADPLVKLPFPPEAIKAANTLRDLGAGKLVDDFVLSLNRAAEDAAKEAGPIFVDAVTSMSIADAKQILFGADNAATEYFKAKTSYALGKAFQPKIKTSLDKVLATKFWTDITTRYNRIPLVTPVNTDLPEYATDLALKGLFLKLEGEEAKIRKDPAARVKDILKRVFGELDKR